MRYPILTVLLFIILSSCSIKKNKIIYNERTKKDILIGECNKEGLNQNPFSEWFTMGYSEYEPETSVINKLKTIDDLNKIKILIVMGTWCGDSRRELPRFYKIIDMINFPYSDISIIAVDTNRSSGDKKLQNIEFGRIPTFIFYKEDKEVGRIVESTEDSLEKDILKIIE
ncbi:MAG: thioredoxin family protein [Bacteroidales bacterium]|nr:thioredoxin family protein [Bacteroidales bacterium]